MIVVVSERAFADTWDRPVTPWAPDRANKKFRKSKVNVNEALQFTLNGEDRDSGAVTAPLSTILITHGSRL